MNDDDFWGEADPSDVSIDTANSHITKQDSFDFRGSIQPELLIITPYEPQACILPQNYELDSLNNFQYLNILSKTDDITNNVINTLATDVLNQGYYN